MTAKHHRHIITLFLILILCANLVNVQGVRADGETPTEPPAATEVAAEPSAEPSAATQVAQQPSAESSVESTPQSLEATPAPEETTAAPVKDILRQAPENTEIVVLNEGGEIVPLAAQEAADITEAYDPMWCPAGTAPGGTGCTTNFPSINDLITNMIGNTSAYAQNGVIYFVATTGNQTTGSSLNLTASNLGASAYNALNDYSLTLQGGWNGTNGAGATFTGQTNFGSNVINIGTGNPWVGNITLNNFRFNGVSTANAVTVYTTSGDITLSNVDVSQQTGTNYAALLSSDSGNISILNGSTFDGDNTGGDHSRGLAATSTSGSITITGTSGSPITFTDSDGAGGTNYNGATLSAPTVTLNYVTASNNDGNGIAISNVNFVNLNNVVSGPDSNNQGNGLSGVLVNGTGSKIVSVGGGVFADNGRYGIEVVGGSIYLRSAPACPTTGNTSNGLGCYSVPPSTDNTGPVVTPAVTGTAGANGWYTSDVSVSWSVSDPQSGILSSTGCTSSNLTSDTAGTTLTCSAVNGAGGSNSASVTIKIDKTAPTAILSVTGGTLGNNGWYTSDVTVHTSGTDSTSNPVTCTADQFQTAETSGVAFGGSCTNAAGLSTTAASINIKLDKTNPGISFSGAAPAATNGWNNTDVTLNWSCSDTGSGPASGTVSQTLSTQGVGLSATGTCTDLAGNSASDTQSGINIDKTPPSLTLPADITQNATSSSGAVVSYTASVSDNFDLAPSMSCNPASGSIFPLGPATVSCSASDSAGNTASGTFMVTIQDPGGPVITVPANITAEATGATGAAVSFTVSATDLADGPVAVSCDHTPGSVFPLGTTAVTCSATDSSNITNTAGFSVAVQDTTAPAIAAHSDFTTSTTSGAGVTVNYTSPTTSDAVDGAGVATCSPASGSLFPIGDTEVSCTATDAHGNTATSKFVVHVTLANVPVVPTSSPVAPGTTGSQSSSSSSGGFTIPLTGGQLIELDCNSVIRALGIKFSFLNLCDQQATIHKVEAKDLPGKLPNSFVFVTGVKVDIFTGGKSVKDLPNGTGIQMDFPIAAGAQYAVLFWDGSRWVEIQERASSTGISQILSSTAGNGLYQLSPSAAETLYSVLTTHKTGIFILVKK